MYDDVLEAISTLEDYADEATGTYPVAEPYPREAAETLGKEREKPIPEGLATKAVNALVRSADVIAKHEFDVESSIDYAAKDLLSVVRAVEAIARLRASHEIAIPFMVELLEHHTYETYEAGANADEGSKEFKRNTELEDAQDEVAEACIESIAKYRKDAAPAMDALEAAFEHRSPDVRSIAKDVHAAILYHIG